MTSLIGLGAQASSCLSTSKLYTKFDFLLMNACECESVKPLNNTNSSGQSGVRKLWFQS